MSSYARKLVSHGKKRLQDPASGVDLDAAYVTDRILIMAWPGTGMETLWRNSMKDVLAFLETNHGRKWRIFNFCPRNENEYSADLVYGQVSRFPFPDHHAPPLSLIPLFTRAMRDWLDGDPERIAVIHCKAGKGRSGTMTCCYLLAMPSLPRPPTTALGGRATTSSSASPPASLTPTSSKNVPERAESGDAIRDESGKQRAQRLVAALRASSARDVTGSEAEVVESPVDMSGAEVRDDPPSGAPDDAATNEVLEIADRLAHVFQLHTDQRIAQPKPGKYGISIPSQRRWVRYWARMLDHDDPRPWLSPETARGDVSRPRARRRARLTRMTVHMGDKIKSLPPLLSGKSVSVLISRYADAFVDDVEDRECRLRTRTLASKEDRAVAAEEPWDDDRWRDEGDMFQPCGTFVQIKEDDGGGEPGQPGVRRLVAKPDADLNVTADGILIDPDRQILIKLLLGKSGSKHSLLPDVAALGYAWVLPAFESTLPATDGATQRWSVTADEIDFLKPQAALTKLELFWEWLL